MNIVKDRRLIYSRYILPPVLLLCVLFLAFVPSYRYTVNNAENEAVSGAELFFNQLTTARETLFIANEDDATHINFAKYVLITQGVLFLLWLIGFAASVFAAISALVSFSSEDEKKGEQWRVVFSVIFPNRAVLCIIQLLCAALPLFPYILPVLYHTAYSDIKVSLALVAPDALIFMCAALAGSFVLTFVSARAEARYDGDLFKKRAPFTYAPEAEEEAPRQEQDKKNEPLSESVRRAKNEQIRHLFEDGDNEKQ